MGEEVRYLSILEDYGVCWNDEKIARDLLQNFFDGNNGDLTGLEISKQRYNVVIGGIGDPYPYEYLLHIGATTKSQNNTSAGGYGEGAKIASFVLLKGKQIKKITFQSNGWKLVFYFEIVPKINKKGLYAKITNDPTISGNYVSLECENAKMINRLYSTFLKSKDYFYHDQNEDFKQISYNYKDKFKIKYLGEGEWGNIYLNGMRIAFKDEHLEKQLGHCSFFFYGKELIPLDRDRTALSAQDVRITLSTLLDSATSSELLEIALLFEDIWPELDEYYSSISGALLLIQVINRLLSRKEEKIAAHLSYLYASRAPQKTRERYLEETGITVLSSFFSNFGFRCIDNEINPNTFEKGTFKPEEKSYRRRIFLLYSGYRILSYYTKKRYRRKLMYTWYPIRIYELDPEEKKEIHAVGYYDKSQFVKIEKGVLDSNFEYALSVYLHEVAHQYGSDYSENFSYKITDLLNYVIGAFNDPNLFYGKELKLINEEWNKLVQGKKVRSPYFYKKSIYGFKSNRKIAYHKNRLIDKIKKLL